VTKLQTIRAALAAAIAQALPDVPLYDTEEAALGANVTRAVVIQPLDAEPGDTQMLAIQMVNQPFAVILFARGVSPTDMIESMDEVLTPALAVQPPIGEVVNWQWLGDRWEHAAFGDGNYAIKRVVLQALYSTGRGQRS